MPARAARIRGLRVAVAVNLVLALALLVDRSSGHTLSAAKVSARLAPAVVLTSPVAPLTASAPATSTSTTAPPTTAAPPAVPRSAMLAIPNGTIPTSQNPGAAPSGTVGTWYGYPLVLPVLAEHDGWVLVRLPQRPNGSIAWVRTSDVQLSSTDYRIVVHLSERRLAVYRSGSELFDFPVGIGTPATPTPTGAYFVTVRAPAPDPGYGPFVLSLNAHSEAIQSWEGAGDAIIAIHGPITSGANAMIGTTGARVSNGCLRLHDADLARLTIIPLGTPVDIYG